LENNENNEKIQEKTKVDSRKYTANQNFTGVHGNTNKIIGESLKNYEGILAQLIISKFIRMRIIFGARCPYAIRRNYCGASHQA